MQIIADFHIHSRYAGGTSKNIDVKNLTKFGIVKGLTLLGTGDITHPLWFKEVKENIEGDGIYKSKWGELYFIVTTELRTIDGDKKVDHLILIPSLEVAEEMSEELGKYANLESDGRLTLNMSGEQLVGILKDVNKEIEIIPAHAWTPWFGVFGSRGGYNSLEECYGKNVKYIWAIETGLSSDPPMNWRVKELEDKVLISNSDAHSFWPYRLGREANIIEGELEYKSIIKALKEGKFFTIEVDPSYGKYHWDGHRKCGVFFPPEESKKYGNICPVCGKPLTLGVLHRVEDLADYPPNYKPKNARPSKFYHLLPLQELISKVYNVSVLSKRAWQIYNKLIEKYKTELNVLLFSNNLEETGPLKEWIIKMREDKIKIRPGYDGVYGEIVSKIKEPQIPQKTLLDF